MRVISVSASDPAPHVSCPRTTDVLYDGRGAWRRPARPSMQLTLLESDRSFLRSAECAALSIVAHVGVIWAAMTATDGGFHLPVTERDARLMFLLPPDRIPAAERESKIPRVGKLGAGL